MTHFNGLHLVLNRYREELVKHERELDELHFANSDGQNYEDIKAYAEANDLLPSGDLKYTKDRIASHTEKILGVISEAIVELDRPGVVDTLHKLGLIDCKREAYRKLSFEIIADEMCLKE